MPVEVRKSIPLRQGKKSLSRFLPVVFSSLMLIVMSRKGLTSLAQAILCNHPLFLNYYAVPMGACCQKTNEVEL